MNATILIDIFLFFARFPERDGIFGAFNKGESNLKAYNEIKFKLQDMAEHSLTDIKHYIFGANFDAVRSRVNNIASGEDYLFVDFGEIECSTDQRNRMNDSARLAVTVAFRVSDFSADIIEQMLYFEAGLKKITAIRNHILTEQKCHPWLKNISEKHTFIPFVSPDFASIGWTMLFNRDGYNSFGFK